MIVHFSPFYMVLLTFRRFYTFAHMFTLACSYIFTHWTQFLPFSLVPPFLKHMYVCSHFHNEHILHVLHIFTDLFTRVQVLIFLLVCFLHFYAFTRLHMFSRMLTLLQFCTCSPPNFYVFKHLCIFTHCKCFGEFRMFFTRLFYVYIFTFLHICTSYSHLTFFHVQTLLHTCPHFCRFSHMNTFTRLCSHFYRFVHFFYT